MSDSPVCHPDCDARWALWPPFDRLQSRRRGASGHACSSACHPRRSASMARILLTGPPPKSCALRSTCKRPFVLWLCSNDGQPDAQIVGYMILSRETWPDDSKRLGDRLKGVAYASFAPVLADTFQSQGFGYQDGPACHGLGQGVGPATRWCSWAVCAATTRARSACTSSWASIGSVNSGPAIHPCGIMT